MVGDGGAGLWDRMGGTGLTLLGNGLEQVLNPRLEFASFDAGQAFGPGCKDWRSD
jgi:hypothetical protein